MIRGEFGYTGQPVVEGYLTLPRFGITRDLTFLVDTGANATCIHPRDGIPAAIPFDQLENPVASYGVGGPATYFRERAILEFVDGDAREIRSYEVAVLIATPAADPMHGINRLPSLLGRDIIDRWRMVYDRTEGILEFTVRSADVVPGGE
ncbi:MAG: hypothetical protein OXL37_04590 [Chloroflexota bacterium]|nr:hypothetical protein [Deltaproteobacteria bacterium]MDE2785921.1 hypothetical protein [Chloroflexota bacterium]MDE2960989.1 hypothetical protein [Chloroflexota bacterium]